MPAVESTSRKTILVCEDDEQLRMLVQLMLSDNGYSVLPAARGEQAVELAAEHTRIDVLVTDVELPQMSGPELVERLQSTLPDLGVLFLSGYPADALPGPPLPDEHAFLQKPFSETSLLEKVAQLVGA